MKKEVYNKFDDNRSVAMSIQPKLQGKLLRNRILMIALYVAYVIGLIVLMAVLQTYVVYVMCFSALTIWMLIFFTWRYVSVEYEFSIHAGELQIASIYGGLSRRDIFSCRVQELKVIAPWDEAGKQAAEAAGISRRILLVSGEDKPGIYYAIHGEGAGQTLLVFETCEKSRHLLRYHNKEAYRDL